MRTTLYVGRIGGLAVALGIGTAVFWGSGGAAHADTSKPSDAATSTSGTVLSAGKRPLQSQPSLADSADKSSTLARKRADRTIGDALPATRETDPIGVDRPSATFSNNRPPLRHVTQPYGGNEDSPPARWQPQPIRSISPFRSSHPYHEPREDADMSTPPGPHNADAPSIVRFSGSSDEFPQSGDSTSPATPQHADALLAQSNFSDEAPSAPRPVDPPSTPEELSTLGSVAFVRTKPRTDLGIFNKANNLHSPFSPETGAGVAPSDPVNTRTPEDSVSGSKAVDVASSASPVAYSGNPSLITRLALPVLKLVKVVTEALGIDVGTQILPLTASDSPPWFTTLGLKVTRSEYDDMPVWTIQTAHPTGAYVVAIHGGGYVVQPTLMHWLNYADIARSTGTTVVVPVFPLASQATAAVVVPALTDFVSSVIDEQGAENVSIYGDSAGGGLAISLAQLLVQRGAPRPRQMVLLSPWLDVSMTNPAIVTIDDPLLSVSSLKRSGALWAGGLDTTDPSISPIYGSLLGLPPTTIYSGSRDLLSPDVLRLQDMAIAQNAPISFVLRSGEIHDWPIIPLLPDALEVRPGIFAALSGHPF